MGTITKTRPSAKPITIPFPWMLKNRPGGVQKRAYAVAAAKLEEAADGLDKWGWCTGTLVDAQGHTCLLGAIDKVAPGGGVARAAMKVAVVHQVQADYGLYSFVDWNDSQRDKRKVQRLMRRAARSLRATVGAK